MKFANMAMADPGLNDQLGGSSNDEIDADESSIQSRDPTHSNASPTKQNGSAVTVIDRYGFMGGTQYTDPDEEHRLPIEKLRKRELKWLEMFDNWEKWMSKRFKKIRDRCRKGIPPSLRSRAWQYLCGSQFLMEHNKGKFEEYLRQPGNPKWDDDIKKDLHRQFPQHEMFTSKGGYGQEDLYRILKAYTIHNPKDGYCQAQAPVAAVLLMHMPAEQAFWCLVSLCEKYLQGYYSPGLEAIQIDGDVLFGLLKKTQPAVYKHIKKQQIAPLLYMTEWFMCLFTRTLPWATVMRVWDIFFCEGIKVMFRVALVLFKIVFGEHGKFTDCPTLYETLEKLRHIPIQHLDEEMIVQETLRLNINERDMEKEHQKQIHRRKPKDNKSKKGAKQKS